MSQELVRVVLTRTEALTLAAMMDGACEQLIEHMSQLGPEERQVVATLQDIRKQLPKIPA